MGLIALAYVFLALGQFLQMGMFLTSRTGSLAIMSGVVAVLTLVANYVLIPRFGASGAAWATVIGFLGIAVGSYYCSQRVLPLNLGIGRAGLGLAAGLGIYGLSRQLDTPSILTSLIERGVLLGLFPVVLWRIGFFSTSDLAVLGTLKTSIATAGKNVVRPHGSVWQHCCADLRPVKVSVARG